MNNILEVDYKPELNLKFFSKIGNPFEFDCNIPGCESKPLIGKKILVIRLFDMAVLYARNNSVTYLTDDPEKLKKFYEKLNTGKFGSDDSGYLVEDWNNFEKSEEIGIKNMKFDVVIMNPPYNRSLHLKIIERILPYSEKVVNISPIRWLQDPFVKYKKRTDFHRFENSISKYIENVELIDAKTAANFFDIHEQCPDLAIYTIGKGGFDYKGYAINSIMGKCLKDRKLCNLEWDKKDGIRVRIPFLGGGKSKNGMSTLGKLLYFNNGMKDNKPWYEWYSKNQHSKQTPEIKMSIKFDSEIEAENFINSIENTKFGKYITDKFLLDIHIANFNILWMNDYKEPWTDDRFYNYFNLTEDEIRVINEIC